MAYSYTLTPKDIYGVEEPEVPKGYKITGFRLPKVGETILTVRLRMAGYLEVPDNVPLGPRLILEKLPEKRLIDVASCSTCPYSGTMRHDICWHPSTWGYGIPNPQYFPMWCPLPTAP